MQATISRPRNNYSLDVYVTIVNAHLVFGMCTLNEVQRINDELERSGETRRWRKATLTERAIAIVDDRLKVW